MFVDGLGDLLVFPCRQSDKAPLTQHSFYDARVDVDHSRWPLVGVPTGEAFDVVDVDPRNGGDCWYDFHFDALPKTRTHATRGGGIHLLFRPCGRKLRHKLAPGVEVQSIGRYVIWWPREGLPIEEAPIAEWPEWLLKLAIDGHSVKGWTKKKAPHDEAELGYEIKPTGSVKLRSHALLRALERAPQGTRHPLTHWSACRFGEMIGAGRVKRKVATDLLISACKINGLWWGHWVDPKTGEKKTSWHDQPRQSRLASVMYPHLASEETQKQMADLAAREGKRSPQAAKTEADRGKPSPFAKRKI